MKGEVVFLYAFDVANEIMIGKVPAILSRTPVPFEIKVEQPYPRVVPLYRPLAIEPPPLQGTVRGQAVRVLIRVYEVGVVSIVMRVGIECTALGELIDFHSPRLDDGRPLDQLARELCGSVCRSIEPFLVRASAVTEPEAYTVFCLGNLDGATDVPAWLAGNRREVAGLLSATLATRLSESQIGEALRQQISYENNDLVVIDWDAALVVELGGYTDDVLFVLELANLQLEEFRMMDLLLDRQLNQAYDDLERHAFSLFGVASNVLRTLRRFRVDLTKLSDEVSNIAKFFGDWYLARVYLAAHERFHLEKWRGSVERRLAQLDQLYSVVHDDLNERRMLWLEVIIVVLFVIDVIGLFFR